MVAGHPLHIPVAQSIAHLVNGEHAIDNRGDGAHGDQGVHVGRPMPERFKAHLVILIVEIHDRQSKEQLGQPEGYGVLMSQQEGRQGSAHHVAH